MNEFNTWNYNAYFRNNWKLTVFLLSNIVSKCCSGSAIFTNGLDISFRDSMPADSRSLFPCLVDASIMLTEAYMVLGRYDDAMQSARLAVSIVHSCLDRTVSNNSDDITDVF